MPLYPYEVTHEAGEASGTIVADTKAEAKKTITKSLRDTETKDNKLGKMSVNIGDPVEEE